MPKILTQRVAPLIVCTKGKDGKSVAHKKMNDTKSNKYAIGRMIEDGKNCMTIATIIPKNKKATCEVIGAKELEEWYESVLLAENSTTIESPMRIKNITQNTLSTC